MSPKPTALNENRGQPRIQAQVPVRVVHPETGATQRALLLNLSWGGALIHCGEVPGALGDRVEVELPYHAGKPITIQSEILRIGGEAGGGHDVAVRFDSISPADEDHLEKVLEMLLSGPGGGKREHPRLVQRLDIHFDDPAEVRATLEDISRGGLAVTVPYSFGIDRSVQLSVSGGAGIGELRLRARVVHQAPVHDGGLELFRIGLKFEHPTRDLEDTVGRLLRKMASREALAARGWEKKK